jgi:hypothetical protein
MAILEPTRRLPWRSRFQVPDHKRAKYSQHRHRPQPPHHYLSYNNIEPTIFPTCDSGVDFEKTDQKMSWKATNAFNLFNFVDIAGGATLYQWVRLYGSIGRRGKLAVGLSLLEFTIVDD